MSDEDDAALSIGVAEGGVNAATRVWGDAVMGLSRRVRALRSGVESPVRVNVVFHIPGEVLGVDFTGVRTGRFSAKRRLLLVQAAVPVETSQDVEQTLLQLLADAIDEAGRWAVRRRMIDGSLVELKTLVEAVARGDEA